jgi:trehalose-6-phosphate synthase
MSIHEYADLLAFCIETKLLETRQWRDIMLTQVLHLLECNLVKGTKGKVSDIERFLPPYYKKNKKATAQQILEQARQNMKALGKAKEPQKDK